ncbi:21 kDa subunit of NADH dehydrogenase [Gloeopeniophorella convolvens]|nr:21 kDa subunit of NADH dehydrogenase [Gloeopeniophorella convolvens]
MDSDAPLLSQPSVAPATRPDGLRVRPRRAQLQPAMATRKVADHTLYHLSPKGFWKKFRDAVAVDPAISSGLPLQSINRQPPPGSRPEKYSTPASKASDPAQNPYWKRDVRRAYPQLSVVTQSELSTLLIQHSAPPELSAPQGAEATSVPATPTPQLSLTEAIGTINAARKAYSASALPPTPPTPFKRWVPERAPDAPHDPNAYFPMILVK